MYALLPLSVMQLGPIKTRLPAAVNKDLPAKETESRRR